MSDSTSPDRSGHAFELEHPAKPDVAVFRLIAAAMGARYAGDDGGDGPVAAAHDGNAADADLPALPHARLPNDPRVAALLDKIPLPILVATARGVSFVNKAARAALGHDTAGELDEAGGLGAVFAAGAARNGAITVTTSTGGTFQARAEMKSIEWADHRAMLVTLEPLAQARPHAAWREAAAAGAERAAPDPDGAAPNDRGATQALLDANPDPVAVISRGGAVDLANAAWAALCEADSLALEERLDPAGLQTVLRVAGEALQSGAIATAGAISVGGRAMRVSAGPVGEAGFACVTLHPEVEPAPFEGAGDPVRQIDAETEAPLESAVATARRLLCEAKVHITFSGGAAHELEDRLPAETERFFRAVLLALGARALPGTMITLERTVAGYVIALAPRIPASVNEIGSSQRLVLFGLEAGLAIAPTPDGRLAIAPLLAPARRGDGASGS